MQTARNGKEAVETARRNTFDLILMDMQMPVMDGYTASKTLRAEGFDAPIIALTADAMKGTEQKCRRAGCTGFLTKPIDMDKLIKSIGEILRDRGHELPQLGTETPAEILPSSLEAHGPIHSTLPTDDADFCEIIAEFEARLREKTTAMREALAEQNYEELSRLAHWLKGSGGTAGFHDFTDLAKELEVLTREPASDQQIRGMLAEIEAIRDSIVVPDLPQHTPN